MAAEEDLPDIFEPPEPPEPRPPRTTAALNHVWHHRVFEDRDVRVIRGRGWNAQIVLWRDGKSEAVFSAWRILQYEERWPIVHITSYDAQVWLEALAKVFEDTEELEPWNARDQDMFEYTRQAAVLYGRRTAPYTTDVDPSPAGSLNGQARMRETAKVAEFMVAEMLQDPKVLAAALIGMSPKDREQIMVLYDALQSAGVGS